MQITRRFTREGQDPFASLEFAPRTSVIRNPNGSVVFEVAVDILAQKYFRRRPVENSPNLSHYLQSCSIFCR